jgi:hypothetical protein
MRSSRDLRLLVLLALACLAGITMLRAQETAPAAGPPAREQAPAPEQPAGEEERIEFPDAPDPNAPPPAQPQPPAGTPAPAGEEQPDEEEPPPETTPRTPGVVGDTPGRFEPTEKVRADFDVSFPVDI